MAYSNVFQPSWRFGQQRQFSYQNAFQPSWAMGQPRQHPGPLPANSTEPGAPPGEVVPFDAALTNALNTADLNFNNTVAGIDAERPVGLREFGYTESGEIDPSNPFSRAQLLQRAYQQSKAGTTNSYAARGQLYSGALQRAQGENQFNYQAQDAQLRGQLAQYLAGLAGRRADAMNVRNNQRSDATMRWATAQVAGRNAAPAEAVSSLDPAPAPTPMSMSQSFTGFQGTPVESYLRALYASTQAADSTGARIGRLLARR